MKKINNKTNKTTTQKTKIGVSPIVKFLLVILLLTGLLVNFRLLSFGGFVQTGQSFDDYITSELGTNTTTPIYWHEWSETVNKIYYYDLFRTVVIVEKNNKETHAFFIKNNVWETYEVFFEVHTDIDMQKTYPISIFTILLFIGGFTFIGVIPTKKDGIKNEKE